MTKYNNTGALFKNDKKETEKQPDYKGSCFVARTEYWLSSWINTDKNGQKYMSLKFNVKEESMQDLKKQFDLPVNNDFDEDIPF